MMVVDSSWVDKAWDLLRAGEYDESIAQCNKVIKKDMRCGEIWYTLGLAYHLKGSAIDDVREQVKAIKPLEWCSSSGMGRWSDLALYVHGVVMNSVGDPKTGVGLLEKARKLISGIDSKQLIMNIDVEIATGKMGEGLMYSSPERIKEGLDGVKKLLKKFKYDCRVVEGNVYGWILLKEYENAKHMLEYWAQHYDKIAKSISYWGYKPETFAKKFSLHRSLIYKGLNGEKIDNNWFRDVYINNYKKAFGKDPLTS